MKAKKKIMIIIVSAVIAILVVLFSLWILSGYLPTRNIEIPSYKVVEKKSGYEVREYEGYVVAETPQKGNHRESLYGGFNELFQYISGNNTSSEKVKMTAPVLQTTGKGGNKIPMTAPVMQQDSSGVQMIAFVMPKGMNIENLPQPKSANVSLREIPSCKVAAVIFSGYANEGSIKKYTDKLLSDLKKDGKPVRSSPQNAFYNPPWTPPFMRRNEVLVEIE